MTLLLAAAWAVLAVLAWHAIRTAARLRRLEQHTGKWRVATPHPRPVTRLENP